MEVDNDEQLTPWLLGALSTGDPQQDARLISGLDKRVAVVDVLECKAANLAEVHKLLSAVPQRQLSTSNFRWRIAGRFFLC
jgi:hypothetical protein